MAWIIWVRELLELIGASMTLLFVLGKIVMWGVKLNMMVAERKLKLNGNHKKERTEMERVFHERDN